jgi:hypothetical protein
MDSQFNSLVQSYSSNYVQYKVTGSPSYQNGYMAAQQGLDAIIGQLQNDVNTGKQQVAAFYKSGVEQKLTDLNLKNRKLQRGILVEKDGITAAKIRGEQHLPPPTPSTTPITTSQYVALGVLGITMVGLMVV